MTNVKPTPGERGYDYMVRVAHERLRRAGANEAEARDFAEVAVCRFAGASIHSLDGWPIEAARAALSDWRAEKRDLAAWTRQDRAERITAGYRSLPVEAPVYLNGETAW